MQVWNGWSLGSLMVRSDPSRLVWLSLHAGDVSVCMQRMAQPACRPSALELHGQEFNAEGRSTSQQAEGNAHAGTAGLVRQQRHSSSACGRSAAALGRCLVGRLG